MERCGLGRKKEKKKVEFHRGALRKRGPGKEMQKGET